MTWTLVLWGSLLALFLSAGAAGYCLAVLELAERHAPGHPGVPRLAALAHLSMSVALLVLVAAAVLAAL